MEVGGKMAHSVSRILVHVVFGVKNAERFIKPEMRGRLSGYFLGILQNLNCQSMAIGCVADHAHLLFVLSRDRAISDVVRTLKASSSVWLKSEFPNMQHFSWQTGYAAFSVSNSDLNTIRGYVRNQETHHIDKSFADEFDKHGNLLIL